MALPENKPLYEETFHCSTPSVGASPLPAHIYAPWRFKVVKVGSMLGGAITSADAVVTTAIDGTAITGGAITIANASSAAGDLDTATPTGANTGVEGAVISFTPASASGDNIPATFFATLRKA